MTHFDWEVAWLDKENARTARHREAGNCVLSWYYGADCSDCNPEIVLDDMIEWEERNEFQKEWEAYTTGTSKYRNGVIQRAKKVEIMRSERETEGKFLRWIESAFDPNYVPF